MKQPRNMEEALDLLAEDEADLCALRKAARMLYNALGKYANESEKEVARAEYFDIANTAGRRGK